MGPRIGLIAGNREFPLHVARAAQGLGVDLVAIGLQEETSPELASLVPTLHWVHLGQLGRLVELLRREQITQVLLAGQVHPSHVTRHLAHMDAEGMKFLARAATHQGRDLLAQFAQYLEAHGMTLLDSSIFLKAWIPAEGVVTARRPTVPEQAALAYGRETARVLAAAGIGQTVVVKDRAVVAVEAMEGTDAAIRRAGAIAGPGAVVVKFPEPDHDMRFDIPVVGASTIEAMREAGATALAIAAGKTLLMDRPALTALADRAGIAITAVEA